MVRLRESYPEEDLAIIGISLDNSVGTLRAFMREHGITYPQICDEKGWRGKLVASWGVQAIPRVFVIDAEGMIRGDGLRRRDLVSAVERLTREPRETGRR